MNSVEVLKNLRLDAACAAAPVRLGDTSRRVSVPKGHNQGVPDPMLGGIRIGDQPPGADRDDPHGESVSPGHSR